MMSSKLSGKLNKPACCVLKNPPVCNSVWECVCVCVFLAPGFWCICLGDLLLGSGFWRHLFSEKGLVLLCCVGVVKMLHMTSTFPLLGQPVSLCALSAILCLLIHIVLILFIIICNTSSVVFSIWSNQKGAVMCQKQQHLCHNRPN